MVRPHSPYEEWPVSLLSESRTLPKRQNRSRLSGMSPARTSRQPRPDPIGLRIREIRLSRGMSLQTLGERVGVAPSHVYHVEKGDKVPSESLAMQLARALGEDPDLFRAWARARSRTDIHTALESARTLARYLQAASDW